MQKYTSYTKIYKHTEFVQTDTVTHKHRTHTKNNNIERTQTDTNIHKHIQTYAQIEKT